VKTAAEWKVFYAAERERADLAALFERAPEVELDGPLVFPHTRLEVSGALVAAVARAIVRSGSDRVLALGVLHGARGCDAELVARARNGDEAARATVRRVHQDGGHATEEFSLDNLRALVNVAAKRPIEIVARFPFLAGDDPASLPGIEDLARLAEQMPIVATTDPIHHGVGYGTPDRRDASDPSTRAWAREVVTSQLDALSARDYVRFASLCADARSDFRDVGPVLAHLVSPFAHEIVTMDLVDYSAALASPSPTWVAAPLIRILNPES
jgi:hypothetical protein